MLVLAGNTIALAATGHALILGKSNTAAKQTTLSRTTTGPVLRLSAKKPTNAPFTTNAAGKVINLNADKVDGLDSTTLRTRSYRFEVTVDRIRDAQVVLPVPNGSYLVSYSATIPVSVAGRIGCSIAEDDGTGPENYRITGSSATAIPEETDFPALSGTGVATKRPGGRIFVECAAPVPWRTESFEPWVITLTPTQVLNGQTLTATPPDYLGQRTVH